MATTRVPFPSAQPVYAAAALWKQRCLVEDRSLFDPSMPSTLEDAQVLVRDFVESPDEGSEGFATKLRGQLATSPTGAVQLAAELLYVYLLLARSEVVSGQRKRAIVNEVLGFDPGTSPLPAELAGALDSGLVRPGQAYNNLRWRMFGYLVQATVAIKSLPPARRGEVLSDPVALTTLLDTVPDQGAWTQRHALEHLLLPDFFPRVVSRQHRSALLAAWPDLAGGEDTPEPLRVAAVVQALEPNVVWGGAAFVNTYRSPYQWQWSAMSERWGTLMAWAHRISRSYDLAAEERAYKLDAYARAAEAKAAIQSGSQEWVTLLKRAFTKDNNLVAYQVYDVFLKWVSEQPEAARLALEQLWQDPGPESVDRFVAAVPKEVLRDMGGRLSVASFLLGAVDPTVHPQWRSRAVDTAYRLVDYPKAQPGATVGETYESFLAFLDLVLDAARRTQLPLQDRLDAQGLVWAMVKYEAGADWTQDERDALASWRAGKGTRPPAPSDPKSKNGGDPTGSDVATLGDLAASVYLEEQFLEEIIQLLRDRGQVIFYGPPGTGKTYVGRRLAQWIAGSPERVTLVQFHPSYAYEDFVEGLRPQLGGSGFELVDGPLRQIARAAQADPTNDYVLVIDELNRGNVARVFGELYFLLEYRNEDVRLMYSKQVARLPANLYFIGTMNSADRSIALLDTALRRRFYFVPFRADEPPVSQVLRGYLTAKHPTHIWIADVVDRANQLLGDPAVGIGPSHFIRDDLDEAWIRRVWASGVMPTLEEHYYAQPDLLAQYDLDRLRREVTAASEDDPTA